MVLAFIFSSRNFRRIFILHFSEGVVRCNLIFSCHRDPEYGMYSLLKVDVCIQLFLSGKTVEYYTSKYGVIIINIDTNAIRVKFFME